MKAKIKTYYFSPTGGTLKVLRSFAEPLAMLLHADVEYHPYTLPQEREALPVFDKDDIVVWATPVYAGRVPNKTIDFVRQALHGVGNPSVAIATFGNRAYDNTLAELVGAMRDGGMRPVGAAAVVTRHVFSDTLGAGRPNACDLECLDDFAVQMAGSILAAQRGPVPELIVPGEAHPEKYYTPLKTNNAPAGFLKAKPSCDIHRCTRCGRCKDVCPMGSIGDRDGVPSFDGTCIKCQACRLECPAGAIAFTDPEYLSHVEMIERTFAEPKRSKFFTLIKRKKE